MHPESDAFPRALDAAAESANAWLAALDDRPIPPRAGADEVKDALGRELADDATDPEDVVRALAAAVEPGLMGMPSARFYGWVIGGTQPAALAADWLVSAWDQNTALRAVTPGVIAAEELAGEWILDLLGLPAGADVGFVTGATVANFTCLAAARDAVLRDVGWDSSIQGLAGGPRVRVIVGAERHDTVDHAVRMLGLGAPVVVPADDQGRIDVAALEAELAVDHGPTIVVLQAGNLHSGAFDDFGAAIDLAHLGGAWVHVDGAFGLWAAASPRSRPLVAHVERADSWATDAHKTLSVPYDCGIAIVADPAALRAAMGMTATYLSRTASTDHADPHDRVPELSRRARGVPTYAALRAMGRDGVTALVDRLTDAATALAAGLSRLAGVEVLNDVVFTQVCVACADDTATDAWADALRADGVAFASSSHWHGRSVLRFSVSNWGTDAGQVERTLTAAASALARV
ncbi:pyridoxal phosphate-dependent decarboxylase family protein [Microbacterium kyungheense]|uniref:Glutamate/tyrosine decarboxylase-like PLP-dependent enzyme n=1 Tax=Microbacterium kyungheense TaxID=1263636 RepID=A0A543FLP8_9MICO|nr:pyridoxal-dependent decarboxylase [Microbacterium kyungheense]TQM34797.1 glutamate/tyrosine decarboxylase-like PLP-dependent enzyme [Microbacterium kyungheense]